MNLPAPFVDYMRTLIGSEEYEKLATALQQEPPVSIRMNESKLLENEEDSISEKSIDNALSSFPRLSAANKVPWASSGFYLDERLTFTFDPLFHAGCYYVQEASSMFVEQAVKQYITEPVLMLDLCASPGGKSTHVSSVLPKGSLLVANEVIRNRSQVLAENITKWGKPNVVVTNNEPNEFAALPAFFDVILTDVPCSGEGMFRKDPVAIEEWSTDNVDNCRNRQQKIISDIWSSLKPGGLLIYSTCTYNTKEDEENIRWIQHEFDAKLLPIEIKEEWGITGNLEQIRDEKLSLSSPKAFDKQPVYHFFPHRTKGEGFFLSVLQKPKIGESEEYSSASKSSKKKDKKGNQIASLVSKDQLAIAQSWLNNNIASQYSLIIIGARIIAFPLQYMDELSLMRQNLRIVQAGIAIGEVKGKDLVPAHALAMCPSLLQQNAFPIEDINYEQAIAYLRKEAITLPATAPIGYILLTYRHIALGFVKNIGNRANNLYPQEWRIRSGYLPEEIKIL